MSRDNLRTVYSTEEGFCPRCGQAPCRCRPAGSLPPEQQTLGILRERKGRGGKTVTVVRDLRLNPQDMKSLAAKLKNACGSGGTVKDQTIEIQGDHREKVAQVLRDLGYKTKMAGG